MRSVSRNRGLLSALCFALALLLSSCGGGGGGGGSDEGEPTTTVRGSVRALSPKELSGIVSEEPTTIRASDALTAKPGDILISKKTALKVSSVSQRDAEGIVTIRGETPALEDVFSRFVVKLEDYSPSPEQFVPADDTVRVSHAPNASARSVARPSALGLEVNVEFKESLTDGLVGGATIKLAPKLTVDIDSDGPKGTAKLEGEATITPFIEVTRALSYTKSIKIGEYNVPVVTPLGIPGVAAVKIPVFLDLEVTAGELKARFSVTGKGSMGLLAKIDPNPDNTSVDLIGSLTGTPSDAVTGFDIGVTSASALKVRTGVSLSAFFDLATPLAAIVRAGPRATYRYAYLTDEVDPPFSISCLATNVKLETGTTLAVSFFGLKKAFVKPDIGLDIYNHQAEAGCTRVKATASPTKIKAGGSSLVTAVLPTTSAFSGAPTGTFSFVMDGKTVCKDVPVVAFRAQCSVTVTAPGTSTVVATYSGDTAFASGSGTASITAEGATPDVHFIYYIIFQNIKCATTQKGSFVITGGGSSFSDSKSFTGPGEPPCNVVTGGSNTFGPYPIKLVPGVEYTIDFTWSGNGGADYSNTAIEIDTLNSSDEYLRTISFHESYYDSDKENGHYRATFIAQ